MSDSRSTTFDDKAETTPRVTSVATSAFSASEITSSSSGLSLPTSSSAGSVTNSQLSIEIQLLSALKRGQVDDFKLIKELHNSNQINLTTWHVPWKKKNLTILEYIAEYPTTTLIHKAQYFRKPLIAFLSQCQQSFNPGFFGPTSKISSHLPTDHSSLSTESKIAQPNFIMEECDVKIINYSKNNSGIVVPYLSELAETMFALHAKKKFNTLRRLFEANRSRFLRLQPHEQQKTALAYILYLYAKFCFLDPDPHNKDKKEVLNIANQALQIFLSIEPKVLGGLADTYTLISRIYKQIGDLQKELSTLQLAIETQLQIIPQNHQVKDQLQKLFLEACILEIQPLKGEAVLERSRLRLPFIRHLGNDNFFLACCYTNMIGVACFQSKKLDKANQFFQYAENFLEKINDPAFKQTDTYFEFYGTLLFNRILLNMPMKDPQEKVFLISRAIEMLRNVQNTLAYDQVKPHIFELKKKLNLALQESEIHHAAMTTIISTLKAKLNLALTKADIPFYHNTTKFALSALARFEAQATEAKASDFSNKRKGGNVDEEPTSKRLKTVSESASKDLKDSKIEPEEMQKERVYPNQEIVKELRLEIASLQESFQVHSKDLQHNPNVTLKFTIEQYKKIGEQFHKIQEQLTKLETPVIAPPGTTASYRMS